MINTIQNWKRPDAETRISEVLDGAKDGRIQRITDVDGVYELKFKAARATRAVDLLARGGPETD